MIPDGSLRQTCDNCAMDIADPRSYPERSDEIYAPLLQLAADSITANSMTGADESDTKLVDALVQRLGAGDGDFLKELVAVSPSAAVARHLWRRMIEAWRLASQQDSDRQIAVTLFALPLVIVVGRSGGEEASGRRNAGETATESSVGVGVRIPGTIGDAGRVAVIMREHAALSGNQAFAIGSSLGASGNVDIARLPSLLAWQRQAAIDGADHLDVTPAPIESSAGSETAHLRFLMGTALAAQQADLLSASDTGGWAMPVAREISRQLASPDASVLVLPQAPQTPLLALQHGRAGQREIGAQLFASNAIRRLRAEVGEPSAVISAHVAANAPSGGELRLSLSSHFDPRRAEGFRCPLYPSDRVEDVAQMLIDLLRDCRVTDLAVMAGVHADRDPQTGLVLLFKPEGSEGPLVRVH